MLNFTRISMRFVIVVFPDHTHLPFLTSWFNHSISFWVCIIFCPNKSEKTFSPGHVKRKAGWVAGVHECIGRVHNDANCKLTIVQ